MFVIYSIISYNKLYILQKYAAQGGREFFFIVNIQVKPVCYDFPVIFYMLLPINYHQTIYC